MKKLVVKKIADNFWVKCDDTLLCCKPRGGLKGDGVFVGDFVETENVNGTAVITKVLPRKNLLIRPPLANLEKLVIVIAKEPKPDFTIIDKLILFCLCYEIEPVICVNKIDMGDELLSEILRVYKNVCEIIGTSTKTLQNIDKLKALMQGHIAALAGQSAVGKSAIINALFGENSSKTGELSEKIKRGKNTTRHCEIFYENNIYISDTAGFTSLDEKLLPVSYFELPYYYPDFVEKLSGCKYKSCTHTTESVSDCAVKRAVYNGEIDKSRYERYLQIFKILNDKWRKTHG